MTDQYHPYRILLYIILVESNLLYKTSFYILTTKRKFYSPLTVSESLAFLSHGNIEAWHFKR